MADPLSRAPQERATTPRICKIAGCEKSALAKKFCSAHYDRLRRYGDALGGGPPLNARGAPAAFIEKAVLFREDACLLWPYGKNKEGYGTISINGKTLRVIRVVCEAVYGPAPEG